MLQLKLEQAKRLVETSKAAVREKEFQLNKLEMDNQTRLNEQNKQKAAEQQKQYLADQPKQQRMQRQRQQVHFQNGSWGCICWVGPQWY